MFIMHCFLSLFTYKQLLNHKHERLALVHFSMKRKRCERILHKNIPKFMSVLLILLSSVRLGFCMLPLSNIFSNSCASPRLRQPFTFCEEYNNAPSPPGRELGGGAILKPDNADKEWHSRLCYKELHRFESTMTVLVN